jgi:hypothetical protein
MCEPCIHTRYSLRLHWRGCCCIVLKGHRDTYVVMLMYLSCAREHTFIQTGCSLEKLKSETYTKSIVLWLLLLPTIARKENSHLKRAKNAPANSSPNAFRL